MAGVVFLVWVNILVVLAENTEPRIEPANSPLVKPLVYGGSIARAGQFPYLALHLYSQKKSFTAFSICSSGLVTPSWVLTAAHCYSTPTSADPDGVIVVGGKTDLTDYNKIRFQTPFSVQVDQNERRASAIYINPSYSSTKYENDVALVRLKRPMGDSFVNISFEKVSVNLDCIVHGWGLIQGDVNSQDLRFANVVVRPNGQCKISKSSGLLCLVKGSSGICKGDSGSPLVCNGKVVGVTSHYATNDQGFMCGSSLEEYFTEIYVHAEWVNKTLALPGSATKLIFTKLIFICAFILLVELLVD